MIMKIAQSIVCLLLLSLSTFARQVELTFCNSEESVTINSCCEMAAPQQAEPTLSELCCSQLTYDLAIQQLHTQETSSENKDATDDNQLFTLFIEAKIIYQLHRFTASGTDPPLERTLPTKQHIYKLHNAYLC